jgi:hypothetical protein
MVKLPAETCPNCSTNLRTGERPEEKTAIWARRGFKTIVVSTVILLPLLIWAISSDKLSWQLIDKMRAGLASCAEPPLKMWDKYDPAAEQQAVRQGFASWRDSNKTRPMGQDPNGPNNPNASLSKEEMASRTDRLNYFASSLISISPSPKLKDKDNWYGPLVGEWDVAWVPEGNVDSENILQGEWNFSWINGGEALQDMLIIPYLWQTKTRDQTQIRATSIRSFNEQMGYWEGIHIQYGRMYPFQASRNRDGNIFESFQGEPGVILVWTFTNVQPNSFLVYVNQTTDNGQSYKLMAEIWAKRRGVSED